MSEAYTCCCLFSQNGTAKAVADYMVHGPVFIDTRKQCVVKNAKRESGKFDADNLPKKIVSLMGDHRKTWIRSYDYRRRQEAMRVAEHLCIPFQKALLEIEETDQRVDCGIIIPTSEVLRFITFYKPELIEAYRAEAYNNDDH